MSCCDFERLVALHVEGDLHASEQFRVEAHLVECSACRILADDLKESQSVLKSIRQDLPDRAMLSSVRARVLNDVAGMEPGDWFGRVLLAGFRQKATLAGLTVALVGGGILWFSQRPETSIDLPGSLAAGPPPVAIPDPLPQSVSLPPAPKAPVRRRPKPAAVASIVEKPKEQAIIKLLTDDPNVIIYWLVDEKGD